MAKVSSQEGCQPVTGGAVRGWRRAVYIVQLYIWNSTRGAVYSVPVRRAQCPDDVFLVVTNFFTSSAPDMQVVFDDMMLGNVVQYWEMHGVY